MNFTAITYSMPWGAVWKYENSTVPRLGEHVSLSGEIYVAVEVRHFPASNSVWISLKSADGI